MFNHISIQLYPKFGNLTKKLSVLISNFTTFKITNFNKISSLNFLDLNKYFLPIQVLIILIYFFMHSKHKLQYISDFQSRFFITFANI